MIINISPRLILEPLEDELDKAYSKPYVGDEKEIEKTVERIMRRY